MGGKTCNAYGNVLRVGEKLRVSIMEKGGAIFEEGEKEDVYLALAEE